jgi:hypothetical protein
MLLAFFPERDWQRPPLWTGFGRWRSLAISFEMLGQFADALEAYRGEDAPLRGDALIALGRLEPLLEKPNVAHPWQTLWSAYRCHALALAGRMDVAVSLARRWCRWMSMSGFTSSSVCCGPAGWTCWICEVCCTVRPTREQRQAELARRRMQADYRRLTEGPSDELLGVYEALTEEYDRGGLPFERCLTRLGHARALIAVGRSDEARTVNTVTLALARRFDMSILEADARATETGRP